MHLRATLNSIVHSGPTRRRELPVRPAPAWLLIPGLIFLAASLACYVQYQRRFPSGPLDLTVYLGGLDAFKSGEPVYQIGYGPLELPFTYPPAALVLFYPLGLASLETTHEVLSALSFAATFLVAWCVTGMLHYRGAAGRIGASAAITGFAVWLEPVQTNAGFGQINALLMALVVADLTLLRRTRLAGVGIGVAAAIKLVPGIFVLYLLATRRFRAAATAIGAFLVLSAIGVAAVPHSAEFWLHGLFIRDDRVTGGLGGNGPASPANQSLRGFFARIFDEAVSVPSTPALVLWALCALAVLVLGMMLAVRAERRGEGAAAMCLVALTALLISPVSWTHHWVWIVPFLVVLSDVVTRLRGTMQTLAAGLPAVVAAVFTVWPLRLNDAAQLQAHGIIWVAHRHGPLGNEIGLQIYVLAGLAALVLAGLWLRREPVGAAEPIEGDAGRDPAVDGTGDVADVGGGGRLRNG
ncbi:glycosyltransferase 87 family protein [Catenuloplanes sp. NPDC051500]|uniref:glycosyltransferase 87 family protein n=1 Tax=Catenuloplanes sp. NPDC051500 TaxID=3363959 RepID=UPI0037B553CC